LNIVAELDSLGNVVSRFVYGTKGHVPDYMVKNGVTYLFITDHLGSVRFVVDIVSGAVVQYISYDEFGNILIDTNPGFQAFGYAGGLYDGQTGLVRFGARDYEARSGRWTAKDPIGFGGFNSNLYVYCINNPFNFIDKNGLKIRYAGGSEAALTNAMNSIKSTRRGNEIFNQLNDSPIKFTIHYEPDKEGNSSYNPITHDIYIDPCNVNRGFYTWSPETGKTGWDQLTDERKLAHELGHAATTPHLPKNYNKDRDEYRTEKLNILYNENPIMQQLGGEFNDPYLTYTNRSN
jgi:RHS repeat-associated protein